MAQEAFAIGGFDTGAFSTNAFAFGVQQVEQTTPGGGGGGNVSGQADPRWALGPKDLRFEPPPKGPPPKPRVRNPIGNFWKK